MLSGANVKSRERPGRAASEMTASRKLVRNRTKGSDPNGETVVSRSTVRWWWNTG